MNIYGTVLREICAKCGLPFGEHSAHEDNMDACPLLESDDFLEDSVFESTGEFDEEYEC